MTRAVFSEVTGTLLLVVAACYAIRYWRLGHARSRLWLLVAVGMVVLSLDEGLSVHERLGHWSYARGWNSPIGNHNDDLFMLGYLLAAVALVTVYGRELWSQPRNVLHPLLAGVAASAASILVDALATLGGFSPVAEETLELLGAGLLLVALRARLQLATGATLDAVQPATVGLRVSLSTIQPELDA